MVKIYLILSIEQRQLKGVSSLKKNLNVFKVKNTTQAFFFFFLNGKKKKRIHGIEQDGKECVH